jgi:hypothetical protein
LYIGIRSRGFPDAAEVAAALDNGYVMPPRQEGFRRGKPRYPGADDANLLLLDHGSARGELNKYIPTAKTLAITVPPSELSRTDDLIEQ